LLQRAAAESRPKAAVPVGRPGLWTKPSVRAVALSTAITKHTGSGQPLNRIFERYR
jgi:hypothetical protein